MVKHREISLQKTETSVGASKETKEQSSESEESEDTNSDSGSGSSAGSSSDSDAPLVQSRPIFLRKKDKKPRPKTPDGHAVLAKAEHLQEVEARAVESLPFDGIDDTDDIDPEAEYQQWRTREKARRKRDRELLSEMEVRKEESVRRRLGINPQDGQDEPQQVHGSTSNAKIGSFYVSDLDERFLKRDYSKVDDPGDHSRPTKYKK